ncbi:hypothetical protein [uncultured Xylophilus sp.]|uniref:helix-turn-helix transcriptional regulator n=1 Tax=uncultured Xylophilus sp. TaxID=296832 RepID=UPI0025E43D6F|nr:hypothetical protein [uncultured Xylophilus sp.]
MTEAKKTIEPTTPDVVIHRQELCKALGVVSDTLRRWMAAGKLPEPDIRMSQKTVGWRLSTLRAAGINIVEPVRPGLQH